VNEPVHPDARAWKLGSPRWCLALVVVVVIDACSDPCQTPEAEKILQQAAAEEGAVRTESGLVFRQLRPGVGPTPEPGNRVQVHYEGRLADGTVFNSSYESGSPSSFALDRVIPGWAEGLQLLHGGGKAKLTIPPSLGYGKKGNPPDVPPCATLIFEVELLGIYD
jgi:FKBP-type peptidyl-prolyl cis-trans isomerase